MKTKLSDVVIINIPNVHEKRGKLAVLEKEILPFGINRVYYLYDVPSDAFRGGHAHKEQESLLIALSGSFDVIVDDGWNRKIISLNKPKKGLLIPKGIWREIENFSAGAVCLVLASTVYNENEYIRDYKKFKLFKGS